jgi:hypothetical protein
MERRLLARFYVYHFPIERLALALHKESVALRAYGIACIEGYRGAREGLLSAIHNHHRDDTLDESSFLLLTIPTPTSESG